MMTLLLGGNSPTALALDWTFYLLGDHPSVRQKLINELDEVLGSRDPVLADLENLHYLEQTVNESLRLRPPVAWLRRQSSAAFAVDGYSCPAGTQVMVSPWVTQRMPEIWPHADLFYPERWQEPAGGRVADTAFFPFGSGEHTCIGLLFAKRMLLLILATVLQHYVPRLEPGTRGSSRSEARFVPRSGFVMRLQKRRHT